MDYNFLAETLLFKNISKEDIASILASMDFTAKTYARGEMIYRAGERIHLAGLVISGSVYIENNDLWGNTSILDSVGKGQMFAETYACIADEPMMVNVIAAQETQVLFVNITQVLGMGRDGCKCYSRLIENLLEIFARKNINLSRRIFHASSKTIRGRVLSYLSFQSSHCGSREFDIPFNRQQLADYLSVERSALSNELSKMQRDGIITFNRNHFVIN